MERLCAYDDGLQTTTFVQVFENGGDFMWRRTAAANSRFDLQLCRGAQTADLLGNGLDSLLCAYDYGGNTTRTFAQPNTAGFQLALLLVTR